MTAKQYLRQIKRLDDLIDAKLEEMQALKTLATKVTSTPKLAVVQASGSQDKTGDIVSKIIDLEHAIGTTVDNLMDLKADVMIMFDQVENEDHRLLLWLRYINQKTWEQIAIGMGYTYKWVHTLHGRALNDFEEIYAENQIVHKST